MRNDISKREIDELKKLNRYTKESKDLLDRDYPIQYLIGYVDFYGIKINVNEDVLIPRYETEYLIEKTIKFLNLYNIEEPKILDMCTGSGVIGITIKTLIPSSEVTISDISDKALSVARENIKEHNLDIEVIKSDLFKSIPSNKYDLIISNPPYVMESEELPRNVMYEPSIALYSGEKGINHIERILMNMSEYLKDEGIVALEINERSESDLILLINKYLDNSYKYKFEKDLTGKTRYLFIFKNLNKN